MNEVPPLLVTFSEYIKNGDLWEYDDEYQESTVNDSEISICSSLPLNILHPGTEPHHQKAFVRKYFSDMLKTYNKIKDPKLKHDVFVYLWLYKNGGIYIGHDIKNVDYTNVDMSTADVYLMRDKDGNISMEFLASTPTCNVWLDLVDSVGKGDNVDGTLLLNTIEQNRLQYEIVPSGEVDNICECPEPTPTIIETKSTSELTDSWGFVVIISITIILLLILFFVK